MYLEKVYVTNDATNNLKGYANEEDIKNLLNPSNEIEEYLLNELDFGERFLKSSIEGSKELIDSIISFERKFEKKDFLLPLKATNYLGISDEIKNYNEKIKEVKLNLMLNEVNNISVESFYTVKSDYMKLLELKSFYDGIASENLEYDDETLGKLESSFLRAFLDNHVILGELPSKLRKYRTIDYGGKKYIRALVSDKYKDYNNKIAVFIALYALENASLKNNEKYKVHKIFLTDSFIKVSFSRERNSAKSKTELEKGFLGINLKNNELGAGKVSLSVSYYIKFKGRLIHLNPQREEYSVKEELLSIVHTNTKEKLVEKVLFGTQNLENFEVEFEELNKKIRENQITEAFILKVLNELSSNKVKKIEKNTRTELLRVKENISKIIDLADFYGKLDEINMDFEEKEYVDYIFYKAIKNWNSETK